MQPNSPSNIQGVTYGGLTPPADTTPEDTAPPATESPEATPTGTTASTSAAVGDVVRFQASDPINGAQLTGFGQVLEVDTDDDGKPRYTVARLDVLGGQLTDDDLVTADTEA